MGNLIENTIAVVADLGLFFVLWLGFGVHWAIAFFASTLIVIGAWWVLAWVFGWGRYLLEN